jgi:hypothetical protein
MPDVFHDGHRRLQDLFDTRRLADHCVATLVRDTISAKQKAFIESCGLANGGLAKGVISLFIALAYDPFSYHEPRRNHKDPSAPGRSVVDMLCDPYQATPRIFSTRRHTSGLTELGQTPPNRCRKAA